MPSPSYVNHPIHMVWVRQDMLGLQRSACDEVQAITASSVWSQRPSRGSWLIKANTVQISSIQSLSHVQLFGLQHSRLPCPSPTPRAYSNTSIESVMPFNHLILCYPFSLPSNFSSTRVFYNESVLPIRWPKYWSFSFSISPSNEYSRLISFRMDWLDLLTVQGTLKSLLQYHSSKTSTLWCSDFLLWPT